MDPLTALSVVIAIVVAWIAYSQYRVQRHQFQLNLYKRRYKVYENARDFAEISHDDAAYEKIASQCYSTRREARFLFDDVKVEELLRELCDCLSMRRGVVTQKLEEGSTSEIRVSRNIVWEQTRDPSTILLELEDVMLKWLDFRSVK